MNHKNKKTLLMSLAILVIVGILTFGIWFVFYRSNQNAHQSWSSCEGLAEIYVADHAVGLKASNFEELLTICYGETLDIYKESDISDGKRYLYESYGEIYVTDGLIWRTDTSFGAGYGDLYEQEVNSFGEPDLKYLYTRGLMGDYIATVWLDEGYTLVSYYDEYAGENKVVGYIRFRPVYYCKDDYWRVFVSDESTRIRIGIPEL